jgi:hypothetical protein
MLDSGSHDSLHIVTDEMGFTYLVVTVVTGFRCSIVTVEAGFRNLVVCHENFRYSIVTVPLQNLHYR